MKTRYGKVIAGVLVACLIAAIFVMALVGPSNAAPTTKSTMPTAHPGIKTAALVYITIYSEDAAFVYDTTANSAAGGFVAIASVTYANAAITVPVDPNFYVGQVNIPVDIRSKRIFVRGYTSTDATPDKNDTQIFAWMCYFDSNGWTRWPGADVYSF